MKYIEMMAMRKANDGDWIQYTPIITATTTNPTFGTGYTLKAFYKKKCKTLKINFFLYNPNAGTGGSGDYRISLPDGVTIDGTKVVTTTTGYSGTKLGDVQMSKKGWYQQDGIVVAVSPVLLGLFVDTIWETNNPIRFWGTSNSVNVVTDGLNVVFTAEIPIL